MAGMRTISIDFEYFVWVFADDSSIIVRFRPIDHSINGRLVSYLLALHNIRQLDFSSPNLSILALISILPTLLQQQQVACPLLK